MAHRRRLIPILVGFVALMLLSAGALYTPDSDRGAMITRYGGPASRFVNDGAGGQIHYRDTGPRGAPALVLIHGANSSLHTWDAITQQLASRYRVIALDLYGHGLTGPNPKGDYSATTFVTQVAKVMAAAGVRRAVWVGNSMGGWVAWRGALARPDLVCGLVLIDASGAQTGEAVKPYLGARLMQTSVGQALLPHISPRFLVRSSLVQTYGDPSRLSETTVTRYWELNRFPGNRRANVARANTDREPEKWTEIGKIAVPALILWGGRDQVIPPSHGKAFANAIPQAALVILRGVGHVPMEEDPAAVMRGLRPWLTSPSPSCRERPHRQST